MNATDDKPKTRVGFIGTGGIAGAHLKKLVTFTDVDLVAMCDVDEGTARQRVQEYGGTPYTDFRLMFDNERLDAVYICTPPFAHGEQERLACEARIPMFIEKPVAVSLEQAVEIGEMVSASGTITSVGYHWRYEPYTEKARNVLAGEKVLGALGYWMGGMPTVPWWRVKGQSGGQHVEQTTHIFDLCRYLVGSEARCVQGVAGRGSMTHVPHYDVDDISTVNIEFHNGAIANITSCCAFEDFRRVRLEVFCRGLVVEVGGGIKVHKAGEIDESLDGFDGLDRDRVFIDAVRSDDPSGIRSDYADALETFRITMAASESFETGKSISL